VVRRDAGIVKDNRWAAKLITSPWNALPLDPDAPAERLRRNAQQFAGHEASY
jgi:hypothetical protein